MNSGQPDAVRPRTPVGSPSTPSTESTTTTSSTQASDEQIVSLETGSGASDDTSDEPTSSEPGGLQQPAEPLHAPSQDHDQPDPVDEAGVQSFPASDPPSWWGRSAADRPAPEGRPDRAEP